MYLGLMCVIDIFFLFKRKRVARLVCYLSHSAIGARWALVTSSLTGSGCWRIEHARIITA